MQAGTDGSKFWRGTSKVDKLIVRCQLCFSKSVMSYSPCEEALCDECKRIVSQGRIDGLTNAEIIKRYNDGQNSRS